MGSFASKQYTEEEMAQVQELVDKIIQDNKVAVFSKSYCPYCKRAKDLLKKLGVDFFVMELDNEDNGAAIQDYLQQKSGQRTVPNIYINQQHIGGCDDLFAAEKSGKLQKALGQ